MDLSSFPGNWKLLTFKKLLYLPHALKKNEKPFFLFLTLALILSGGALVIRLYTAITVPVPAAGGTFTEGMLREPHLINPIYVAQDTDRDIARLIYSGLITYSGTGDIIPDLAEKYDISEDGKTYTVTLRENAYWHDGERVTADDVIFTVHLLQNPQYRSVYRANWLGVTAEKIDDRVLKFSLRTPYSPFIENLAIGILPRHLWEGISPEQALIHELNLKPVGSGPYVFKNFTQEENAITSFEFERNGNYYREGPYLKNIKILFFKTYEELISAWHKNMIDGFSPAEAGSLAELNTKDRDRKLYSIPMPRIVGIFLNPKHNTLIGNSKIESAIVSAIDKKVLSQIPAGGAEIASYPIPFLQPAEQENKYDPGKASEVLEAEGWKDTNGDGFREKITVEKKKETRTDLAFTLTTSDWPELILGAEKLKEMLEAVGIKITLDVKTYSDLESGVIRSRNFDMLLFGQVYGYAQDPFAFWHSSQIKDPGLNISLYTNKKADALLEEARRLTDKNKLTEKFREFSEVWSADNPAIFLYTQRYLYTLPSQMHNPEFGRIGLPADRFNEINKWYLKTKRVFAE